MNNSTDALESSPAEPGREATGLLPTTMGLGIFSSDAGHLVVADGSQLRVGQNRSHEGQDLFLTTSAAHVISTIFVWSALLITSHHVRGLG